MGNCKTKNYIELTENHGKIEAKSKITIYAIAARDYREAREYYRKIIRFVTMTKQQKYYYHNPYGKGCSLDLEGGMTYIIQCYSDKYVYCKIYGTGNNNNKIKVLQAMDDISYIRQPTFAKTLFAPKILLTRTHDYKIYIFWESQD